MRVPSETSSQTEDTLSDASARLEGLLSGMAAVYKLWDEMADFPVNRVDEALMRLMRWIQEQLDADNVAWLGSLLMLEEPGAESDALLGWRLRASRKLVSDTPEHRALVSPYYTPVHYSKLSSSYYSDKHGPDVTVHVGATSRAVVEGAGKFRVHRLRDGWVDYKAFRRTEHYRLYYTNPGITDRIWVCCPVDAHRESIFLIDRHRRPDGEGPREDFTAGDAAIAAHLLRGRREFHRRLLLSHGVLRGAKVPSPLKQRILQELLSSRPEKEIAAVLGQRPLTLRKHITELYAEFGVKTRPAFMALWLGGE